MESRTSNVAAIVPAFNEQETISNVVSELQSIVDKVVVVDDASTDETALRASISGAYVISHSSNQGYDHALVTGLLFLRESHYPIIVTVDGDGQHKASDVSTVINRFISDNSDIALGIRSRLPRISERIFSFYAWLLFGVGDITCGLKCYSTSLLTLSAIQKMPGSIGTSIALEALKDGRKCSTVPIATPQRLGESRFGSSIRSECRILRSFLYSLLQ